MPRVTIKGIMRKLAMIMPLINPMITPTMIVNAMAMAGE